jgi:hypothetical protein
MTDAGRKIVDILIHQLESDDRMTLVEYGVFWRCASVFEVWRHKTKQCNFSGSPGWDSDIEEAEFSADDIERLKDALVEYSVEHVDEESDSAHWSLSKAFDDRLRPFFQFQLRRRLKRGKDVYQLLIALDNLCEDCLQFEGSSSLEFDQNTERAQDYLERIAVPVKKKYRSYAKRGNAKRNKAKK